MDLEDLYNSLSSSHIQAQGIVDTVDEPLVVVDPSLTICSANQSFFQTFGMNPDDVIGHFLFEIRDSEWDQPDLRHLIKAILPRATAIIDYEISLSTYALGERTFLLSARRLAQLDDKNTRILIALRDVSTEKHADERKDILWAESEHRMKNQLAVLRALITLTDARGRSGEEYRDILLQRFETFADAQALISSAPTGTGSVDIKALLLRVMNPFVKQIHISSSPYVLLTRAQVTPLSFVFNELSTNAAKYGSLSRPEGKVEINWGVENGALTFDWRETGGPPAQSPDRAGFGSRLITYSIANDLGGTVERHYETHGLHVRMKVPQR